MASQHRSRCGALCAWAVVLSIALALLGAPAVRAADPGGVPDQTLRQMGRTGDAASSPLRATRCADGLLTDPTYGVPVGMPCPAADPSPSAASTDLRSGLDSLDGAATADGQQAGPDGGTGFPAVDGAQTGQVGLRFAPAAPAAPAFVAMPTTGRARQLPVPLDRGGIGGLALGLLLVLGGVALRRHGAAPAPVRYRAARPAALHRREWRARIGMCADHIARAIRHGRRAAAAAAARIPGVVRIAVCPATLADWPAPRPGRRLPLPHTRMAIAADRPSSIARGVTGRRACGHLRLGATKWATAAPVAPIAKLLGACSPAMIGHRATAAGHHRAAGQGAPIAHTRPACARAASPRWAVARWALPPPPALARRRAQTTGPLHGALCGA